MKLNRPMASATFGRGDAAEALDERVGESRRRGRYAKSQLGTNG